MKLGVGAGATRVGIEKYFLKDLLGTRMGYVFSPPGQQAITAEFGFRFNYASINYAYTGPGQGK